MVGEKVSHYKILEKLGGGGMGVVYKAQDIILERPVALKFLPHIYSFNEEFKQNIIREAKIAATLDHPNICTIHEVGETEDGQIFIAMAYYEGETLKKKINNQSLNESDIESIVLQIAKGLEAAHKKGIVHKDIKPENIFITEQNEVKILDFGVAKVQGEISVLDAGKVQGTIAYMSPEQISGEEIDERTDIWAYGILLYELITGNKPFSSEYEQTALYSIMHDDPDFTAISEHKPQNAYLKDVIQKCLKKNKADRFQSMDELFTYIISSQSNNKINDRPYRRLIKNKSVKYSIYFSVLALMIIVSILLLKFSNTSEINLKANNYVLVSDFKNRTDNKIFDYSLSEALKVALRQSTQINILPKYRINHSLSLMKIPKNKKIDDEISIKIGKREDVPFIVSGEISKSEDSYIITASILDVNTSEKIKLYVDKIKSIENILQAIDNLAIQIRKDLGESVKSISSAKVPLAKVTTPSIEALDLYSRGSRYESRGEYIKGIDLKEKALSIDSLFVKAISDLSYDYYKIGNLNKAIYYHKKVLPLINRVSEREQFSILVIYYGPTFEMDYQKAFQYARKWTLLYPKDFLGFATLAHLAMYAGQYQTSINANRKAIGLDSFSAGTIYNNTGFTYALKGNPDSALMYFKLSQNLRPKYTDIDIYMAKAFWMNNKLDSTENRLKKILPITVGIQKAKVYALLSSVHYLSGKLNIAYRECELGSKICLNENKPGEEAYFHYLKAEIELARGNLQRYNSEMEKTIQLSSSPFFEYCFAGASWAKNGERKRATKIIDRLQKIKNDDPHFNNRKESFINYIKGLIAISEGKYKGAKELLKSVKKFYSSDPIYLMAQKDIADCSFFLKGQSSIQLYKGLLSKRGEIFMSFLPSLRNGGFWVGKIWTDTYYKLGLAYLEDKDTINAKKYLNEAQNFWQFASPDFKKMKIVQEKLSQISGK